jgi:ABC-type Mn2+/Zn2+ transport system ATPase subunit
MSSQQPANLISARSISCMYGNDVVLSEVDLEVAPGDFVGVVGPSGSGKSTLLRALSGSMSPSAGSIERAPHLRVGFVPQVETVNWDFPVTVSECVLMARTRSGRRWPWPSREEKAELNQVLEQLGLGGLAGRHIRALSGGQQQRMFIARALLTDADLLLLDEPTSGLDVKTRHEVLHLLDDLTRPSDGRAGLAVVLTTHDLNGIAAHLPHLVCLNQRVIGAGSPTDVLTPEVLEATYGSPMEVLEHGGMPVVVDARTTDFPRAVA